MTSRRGCSRWWRGTRPARAMPCSISPILPGTTLGTPGPANQARGTRRSPSEPRGPSSSATGPTMRSRRLRSGAALDGSVSSTWKCLTSPIPTYNGSSGSPRTNSYRTTGPDARIWQRTLGRRASPASSHHRGALDGETTVVVLAAAMSTVVAEHSRVQRPPVRILDVLDRIRLPDGAIEPVGRIYEALTPLGRRLRRR